MEKLNVFQKLGKARVMLQGRNIKPTGKNQGRFEYYELEDFLPHVTQICNELGLLPVMSYTTDTAVLTIYDTEGPETLTLESPMSTAQLSGCHPVQNLGAVQTYLKRYLYTHAFDIAESDILDGTIEPEEKPKKVTKMQPTPKPVTEPSKAKATPEQIEKLNELKTAFTKEELMVLKNDYGHDIDMLIDKMTEYKAMREQSRESREANMKPSEKVKAILAGESPSEQFKDDSQELYR